MHRPDDVLEAGRSMTFRMFLDIIRGIKKEIEIPSVLHMTDFTTIAQTISRRCYFSYRIGTWWQSLSIRTATI